MDHLLSMKKYDCTVYNGHNCACLQKLNHKIFEDWLSLKIETDENFMLGYINLEIWHGNFYADDKIN